MGRPKKRCADQLHLEDSGTGNTPKPLFEHDDDGDDYDIISNFYSELCAIRYEESEDFLVSVAIYIIVPNKDLKLMSSTQCQSPVFLVCCPAHIFYTKQQTNNSKMSA